MNIDEFRKDMRSGMPLEDVLKKHNVSFNTAWGIMSRNNDPRRVKKKKKKKSRRTKTNRKYVSKMGKKYYVRKRVNRKVQVFGSYKTLKDAIKVRDCLIEEGWNKNKLKSIWKKCGINQEE